MNRVSKIATRHWKYLLGFNLLVATGMVGAIAKSQKVWTATTKLILPDTSSHLEANLGTLGSIKNSDPNFSATVNPLKVQAAILTSDALLERVWANDPEKSKFPNPLGYGKLFNVAPQEQSTIILMSANGSSPELALQRAIALSKAYQQRLNELRQANGMEREQFSQNELEQAKARLSQAQTALARFKESAGLANSEAQIQGLVTSINNLVTAQAQAQAQARAGESRVEVLSNRLNLTPTEAIQSLALGENKDYQFVRTKLSEVEANLVQLRSTYTDDYPKVRDLLSQRDELQRQLQRYIIQVATSKRIDTTIASDAQGRAVLIQQLILAQSEASAQQRQATQLQLQIEKLNKNLNSIPANQARLQELQRQSDIAEGVYKGLIAQVQQNNLDSFNAYPNIQVLDPPTVDSKPVSPKMSLMIINALLASIIGSITLVLLLERRNPLLSPKDLQGITSSIVVTIPWIKQSGADLVPIQETEVEFQRLASAISLQSLKDRCLLVTSAIMGEGKTTVTLGLATALVDLGFRVLMVDGDFRQAALSRRLVGYMHDLNTPGQPVQIQPSLDLLPTLPKQGKIVELVRQGRFEQVLAAAKSFGEYDYVLVDSAPVSLTIETALMAAVIPNVLFVVKPGTSYRNSVNYSLDQLAQHHAQILGLAINGTETKSRSYPYRSHASVLKS